MENEMMIIFISSLKALFYERLVGNAIKNLIDMVLSSLKMLLKVAKSQVGNLWEIRNKSQIKRKKERS